MCWAASATRSWGGGQAFDVDMFQTFAAGDFAALGGTGSAIEEFSGPIATDYLHIGRATSPGIVLDNGTVSPAIENSQLLAAAYFQRGDGLGFNGFEIEGFALSAIPAIGESPILPTPGTLEIDRVSGNVTATIELHTLIGGTVLDFGTSAFSSAYLNDANFGIGTKGFNTGIGGFLVSGKATSLGDACTCAYLHWGYWAYGEDSPPSNTNAAGVFVAGISTPIVDMPMSGTATFTGVTEAAWRGATVSPMAPPNPTIYANGAFEHTVNFATGDGSGVMTLNGETFFSTSVHILGNPNLRFAFTDDMTKGGAGVGIFTGPQAKNMGVTYNLIGPNGFGAAGVIRAERGAITR